MSKQPTNEVLLERLENLTDKVKEGFTGIHDRQDTTNGNVKKNTEWRLKVQANIDTFKVIVGLLGVGNLLLVAKLFMDIMS